MTEPTWIQVAKRLTMNPRGGAIGSEVAISTAGLPPEQTMIVAFANLQSYELVRRVDTDKEGNFSATIVVPTWAELDTVHYIFVSLADERPRALSEGFHVTTTEGVAHAQGTIGRAENGCVEMKNADDVLYNLVGDIGAIRTGEQVRVTGTITDEAVCGGIGVALQVTTITRR